MFRASSNLKLFSLVTVPELLSEFIRELTCKTLELMQIGDEEVREKVEHSFDTLLESWVVLLVECGTQVELGFLKIH